MHKKLAYLSYTNRLFALTPQSHADDYNQCRHLWSLGDIVVVMASRCELKSYFQNLPGGSKTIPFFFGPSVHVWRCLGASFYRPCIILIISYYCFNDYFKTKSKVVWPCWYMQCYCTFIILCFSRFSLTCSFFSIYFTCWRVYTFKLLVLFVFPSFHSIALKFCLCFCLVFKAHIPGPQH